MMFILVALRIQCCFEFWGEPDLFVQYRPDKDVWAYGVEPAKVRYRLRLARYPALAEYLQEWLQEQSQSAHFELLDIGAGFGRTFLYLQAAKIAERFNLRGVDIDPHRKDHVYRQNSWTIEFGDAEAELEYPTNSLDIVVCEQLLEHLNNPKHLIDEVSRILKPHGLFIVGVPIFPEPIAKLRRWWVRRHGLGSSDHIQTYSLKSIRRDLAEHFTVHEQRGFRIISGGLLRRLENYQWWYHFNRRLGEWLPSLCIEVQLIAKNRPSAGGQHNGL